MSKVIGHRGCAGHAPENTLAGIRDAARMGLYWIEADATLLNDGSVVLFHDGTLDRCTNKSGFIRDQNWPDILKADAGFWFDKGQYVGERIPLLEDVLKCIGTLGLGFNLELKTHRGEGERLANAVADILEKDLPEKLLISSFDQIAIQQMANRLPSIPKGMIFDELPDDWQDCVEKCNAKSIHLWERHITADQVNRIKLHGLETYVFTVNEKDQAKRLWDMGVDGVFSDYPDRL